MKLDFPRAAAYFKALSDETRLRVAHILSCGELCACDLLDYFDITQPTLSHHLSILVESGLVLARPEGKWVHYALSAEAFGFMQAFTREVSSGGETCQCRKRKRSTCA